MSNMLNTPVDVTVKAFYRHNPDADELPVRSARAAYNRWANNTVQMAFATNRTVPLDAFEQTVKEAQSSRE